MSGIASRQIAVQEKHSQAAWDYAVVSTKANHEGRVWLAATPYLCEQVVSWGTHSVGAVRRTSCTHACAWGTHHHAPALGKSYP